MRHPIMLVVCLVGASLLAHPVVSAPTPGQRCAADKLRTAAKKAQGLLTCHARAVTKGQDVDAACVQKVRTKYEQTWAKIEARGGCATAGDVDTIEGHIDTLVDILVAALPATTTTTTSTSTTLCPPPTALYCGINACPGIPFPQFCPTGQTCETTPTGCTCVGPAVPCGDIRIPLCQYGTCPAGQTCVSDPGSGTCPPTCGCQ